MFKKTIFAAIVSSFVVCSPAFAVGAITGAMEKAQAERPADPFDVAKANAKTYGRGSATVYPRSGFRGNQASAAAEASAKGTSAATGNTVASRWKQDERVNLATLSSGAKGRTSTKADSYDGAGKAYALDSSQSKMWGSSGGCGGFFSCLFDW